MDGFALCLGEVLRYLVIAADESGVNATPDSLTLRFEPRAVAFWRGPIRLFFFGHCTTDLSCLLFWFVGCLIGLAADVLRFVEEFPEPHEFLCVCHQNNGIHFGSGAEIEPLAKNFDFVQLKVVVKQVDDGFPCDRTSFNCGIRGGLVTAGGDAEFLQFLVPGVH
eukprot:g32175.t1